MKIIFITHATAEATEPQGSFRPVSSKGLLEIKTASGAIALYFKKYSFKRIDGLLSSSAVRCVNTVFDLANRLRVDHYIEITDGLFATHTLNEKQSEKGNKINFSFERIKQSIKEAGLNNSELILLSVHGDFASILPQSKILKEETDASGFFKERPITGVLNYSLDASSFNDTDILECDKISSGLSSIIKQ